MTKEKYLSALLRKSKKPESGNDIYMMCKAIDGLEAEGTFILAAARVNKYFYTSNSLIYYTQLSSIKELSYVTTINRQLEQAKFDQSYAMFLQLDFECFQSIYNTDSDGLVPIPTPGTGDRSLGRHAVEIIGFDESTELIEFGNTWGARWSKKGIGYLTTEYLKLYGKEILIFMNGRYGLTHEKFERYPEIQTSPAELAKVWVQENPSHQENIEWNGRRLNIIKYNTLSTAGEIVEIFDLRNDEGKRLGWAHLRHIPKSTNPEPTSIIEELFIWPIFRHKGYGSILEKYCCDYSRMYGSENIRISFTEMDDLKVDKSPCRLFTAKLGYLHVFKKEVTPCTTGYAEKTI